MMSVLHKIRSDILDQIRPTQAEIKEGFQIFNQIKQAIQHISEKKNVEVSFINLEGSSGRKQTQLRKWRELDIFIGLPTSMLPKPIDEEKPAKKKLRKVLKQLVEEIAVEALKEAGCSSWQVKYAEHPYVSATLDNYKADIIFGFDLTPEYICETGPITAVDRTPHHSQFVDSQLSKKQRDDVRLLKAFFHSVFVYGDTSPVGRSGFTGFSTEMLVYHNQSLESVFEFLSQPSPKPLDYFSRPSKELQQRFRKEELIITDPTDPNRNIASSISERACRFAQHNASQLLRTPSPIYFKMTPIPVLTSDELKIECENYFVIEFQDKTGWHYTKTRDKLYRYFTKFQKFLSREATGEPRFGSVVFEEVFEAPMFVIALNVEKKEISESYTRAGPPADLLDEVDMFTKKHSNSYLRNGRYHVEIQRPFNNVDQAIQHFLVKNTLSPKLTPISVSNQGSTVIGKQALWILKNAVQPFIQ
jgi:tRNA nucleotidyltransferase (CCA-adding enzyme)